VIPAAWTADNLGAGAEDRSDEAEVAALARGDDQALSRLIRRWQRRLFAFAYRYLQNETDAADLVAETFVKLHQQRGRLAVDTNLPAWLFTVLANLCRSRLRWAKRHPTDPLDLAREREILPSEQPGPASALQALERTGALQAAIATLPHELKATLLLHHYEQLSYRKIAAITGCTERGVETRLYRARQRLRDALGTQFLDSAG
jgi:RNA polymerase sigma-70 factor, ECF subfamily